MDVLPTMNEIRRDVGLEIGEGQDEIGLPSPAAFPGELAAGARPSLTSPHAVLLAEQRRSPGAYT